MNRVIAVVEGQTEQTFVRDILAPQLAHQNIWLTAQLIGKRGHKGGIGEFSRAQNDILRLLKQDQTIIVTTMFDFYGMPLSWPGREAANNLPFEQKPLIVEQEIKKIITESFGSNLPKNRFIPYIQMHEYEALLFSKPSAISQVMNNQKALPELQRIYDEFQNPEKINDHPQTAPSKRITKIFPRFKKPIHGFIAVKKIPFELILDKCLHFRYWVEQLKEISQSYN